MSGIFGGGSVAKAAPEASSIRITTSNYGRPIPLAWGRVRVSGFMLWYGDFKAIAHEQDVGGKGGVSGASVNYTYEAAIIVGLVEGPINSVTRIWRGKEDRTSTTSSNQTLTKAESFFVDAAGGSVTLSPPGTIGTVQQAVVSWGMHDNADSVTLVAGTNYTQSGTTVTFSANPVLGSRQVTITYTYTKASAADSPSGLLGLTVFKGDYTQAAWSHLTTNHASEAINYRGIAYVAAPTFNLGSSSDMPNMGFELETAHGHSASIVDVNPRDFVVDFLTNPYYGAYFPSDKIGNLADYGNYCVASGLFLSPDYTEQAPANEMLERIAAITNSDWVHVDGKFTLVPYADQSVTGNGVTWVPNLTAQYELGPDDFVDQGDEGPITIERKSPSERYNNIKLKFKDRALQYNDNVAEGRDEAEIAKNGLRPAPQDVETPEIKLASVADTVVNLMVQRAVNVCNNYRFVLKANKAPLAPLDLVALTHPGYSNMSGRLVRIIEIEEDVSSGDLQCLAEEVPVGTASSITYPLQTSAGYTTNFNVTPSATAAPLIFEMPSDLSPETGLQLGIAATSVGAHWGGCQVWVSFDNSTYKLMGVIRGGSRYGVLTSAVGSSVGVQLTNTTDQLLSGSASDLASLATLCYIPGASAEFLAYLTATLTAPGAYTLASLSRAAYGSVNAAHAIGDSFVRIDDRVLLSEPLPPNTIGKTLYFKLCSFNEYEAATQSLAEVTAVPYTVTGKHRRSRSFRAISRGSSDAGSPVAVAGLYYPDTGTPVVQLTGAPTYLVARINLSTGAVESASFDLTASGTTLDTNAAAMAAYLNASTSSSVVVVLTWGNAQVNRLRGGIPEAMYRCGASRAVFASPIFKIAGAYVLVGVPGSGEGNGTEAYQGAIDSAPSAWCDVYFQLKDGRVVFSAPTPTGTTLAATDGKSLARPLETWDLMGQAIVDVGASGKVGSRALFLKANSNNYPHLGELRAIDASRKYRTRFWAKPDAATNGQLFFTLRQFTDSSRTPGPVNGGRSPYKPSGITKAAHETAFGAGAWGEYSYVWDNVDWQANVKFVEPEFLDNYTGTAGGWYVQDFTFEEVTEVVAAKTTADSAATTASTASSNATSALSTLATMRSNGYLDAAEKPAVIREWNAIAAENAGIYAQGLAYGLTTLSTTYQNAYTALGSYLSALSPGWADTTTDTPIVPATDQAKWGDYYASRQTLLNAIAEEAGKRAVWAQVQGSAAVDANIATAQSTATAAQSMLATMRSNGYLDAAEKPAVIREWSYITGEYTPLTTQAGLYGISTEKTAYDNAYSALGSYLSSLSPGWSDTTTDTPITPAVDAAKWSDYYNARGTLTKRIAEESGKRANWGGVSFGLGVNLLYNGDFAFGASGWSIPVSPNGELAYYANAANPAGAGLSWALNAGVGDNSTTFQLQQPNGTTTGYFEMVSAPIEVTPGTRVGVSAYTGAHRCIVDVFFYRYTAAGVYLGASGNDVDYNNEAAAGGQLLSGYKRHFQYADVESTCAYIKVAVRKFATKAGYGDSWMMLCKAMVEPLPPTATQPGPWAASGLGLSGVRPITSTNVTSVVASNAMSAHSPYHSASTFLDMPNGGTLAEVTITVTSSLSISGPAAQLTISGHVVFDITNSTTPPWYILEAYVYVDGTDTPSGVSPPLNVYNQTLTVTPPQSGTSSYRLSVPLVASISGLSAGTHSLSVKARMLVPSSHAFGTTSQCWIMPQLLIIENKR